MDVIKKNKSVRAADDRPYADTEAIYRAVVGDGVPDIPRKMRRDKLLFSIYNIR